MTKKGFTLIELLVVILIIGILAAVAVPQYQKAVEKTRMVEAIINVRAIANAHLLYYLTHGEYAGASDIEALDWKPTGILDDTYSEGRIKINNYVYSPNQNSGGFLALAIHIPYNNKKTFYLAVRPSDPNRIICTVYADNGANKYQKELCNQLNETGFL